MEVEVAMTEREQIYANIRRAIADVPVKTAYPQWNERIAVSCGQPVLPTLWEVFSAKLVDVNGRPMEGIDPVGRYLHESGQLVGYCDLGLAEGLRAHQSFEGLELCTEYDEGQIDHYAFGINQSNWSHCRDRYHRSERPRYDHPSGCPHALDSRRHPPSRGPLARPADSADRRDGR